MEFYSATSRSEAIDRLAQLGGDALVLAGGTDVMMQVRAGERAPTALVHVGRIPDLSSISVNGSAEIGALATHEALRSDARLRRSFASVAESAATVGGRQTQSVGTVGGNVCNASPAADVPPALLVHDAIVVLDGPAGQREVALADFIKGRRRVDRRPDELVTAFRLSAPGDRCGDAYVKIARRKAMEVAVVGVAAAVELDDDLATIVRARIAVCSVTEVPFRCAPAEAALHGADWRHLPGDAGRAVVSAADPIDDPRASAAYRLRVLPGAVNRAIEIAAQRAATSTTTGADG